MKSLRAIPAVEKVLQALGEMDLPRPAVVAIVRRELASLRSSKVIPDFDTILSKIRSSLLSLLSSRLTPLINGTGILIHTNLGRAPLSAAAIARLAEIGANYNNLEYDRTTGDRGNRAAYLEHILALLCGAESATVVNNNAAALVLILRHFISEGRDTQPRASVSQRGRASGSSLSCNEVIISRGELVQIGGGFRIPDVLESSGAHLREVGATNKTSLVDYAKAINKQTALILKVHRSNFFMGGFVESPATEAIAALARKKRIPFVEDLGSGAVVQTEKLVAQASLPVLEHEPTPAEVLKRGVDLVCFSGDKLLGGPQAGIIAGKTKLVAVLKREPLFRALRCDKLIFAALEATVDSYLNNNLVAQASLPVIEMLRVSNNTLRARAEKIVGALASLPLKTSIGTGKSQIGGGTLPRSVIESVTLDLVPQNCSLEGFAARLRAPTQGVAVIGYIERGCFKLDLRTIFPRQDDMMIEAIRKAL